MLRDENMGQMRYIPSLKLIARPWKSPSFLVNTIKMVDFPASELLVYREGTWLLCFFTHPHPPDFIAAGFGWFWLLKIQWQVTSATQPLVVENKKYGCSVHKSRPQLYPAEVQLWRGGEPFFEDQRSSHVPAEVNIEMYILGHLGLLGNPSLKLLFKRVTLQFLPRYEWSHEISGYRHEFTKAQGFHEMGKGLFCHPLCCCWDQRERCQLWMWTATNIVVNSLSSAWNFHQMRDANVQFLPNRKRNPPTCSPVCEEWGLQ